MEVILIVHCLFNRVDVCRGYKLHIDFNFDYQQFLNGLDSGEAAQKRPGRVRWNAVRLISCIGILRLCG